MDSDLRVAEQTKVMDELTVDGRRLALGSAGIIGGAWSGQSSRVTSRGACGGGGVSG